MGTQAHGRVLGRFSTPFEGCPSSNSALSSAFRRRRGTSLRWKTQRPSQNVKAIKVTTKSRFSRERTYPSTLPKIGTHTRVQTTKAHCIKNAILSWKEVVCDFRDLRSFWRIVDVGR